MAEEEKPYTVTPLGPRGASLEDSYRHVLMMQSAKEPPKSRGFDYCGAGRDVIPPKAPTHDEYATNMYRLSQFEPVYHDLEDEGSRTSSAGGKKAPSPSPRSSRSFELRTASSGDSAATGMSSHRGCWPSLSLSHSDSHSSPIASERFVRGITTSKPYRSFSSPRKTLALAQERKTLVASKERKAVAPKSQSNASPEQEDAAPILAGSDPLDSSSVITGMSQQELLRRKARAEQRSLSSSQRKSAKKKKDRILNLPSGLLGGSKKPPPHKTKHYAEINIKKSAVVVASEEAKECPRLDSKPAESAEPSRQGRDRDDNGPFPILSKHSTLEVLDEQSEEDPADEPRSVRFSKEESSTHVFNDLSDRPSDESDYASEPADEVVSSDLDKPAVGEQSFNSSSSGGLKSILRPARFSPTKSSSDSREHHLEEDESVNKSISKSPPRGGTGFVEAGVELSPIAKGDRRSTAGTGGGVTFRASVEEANSFYPDPDFDAPTDYSDPTLDVTGEDNTDEDSTMSTGPVGFIQNVASIVIQTAFRRYQANRFVERLRRQKQLSPLRSAKSRMQETTPPRPKVAHIRATLPAQDHARQVRESLGLPQPHTSQYSDPIVDTSPLKLSPAQSKDGRKGNQLDPFEERLFTLAAVQIQSLFRGFWVRDCLNVDRYCATLIQRAYRSHCCRMEYDFQVYRIVIAQSVCRRRLARMQASHRMKCVLLLQSISRQFLQRRRNQRPRTMKVEDRRGRSRPVRITFQRRYDNAAVLIQKQWRSFYYETNYLKTLLDVLLVQTAVRRWFAVRKVKHTRAAQQRLKRRHRYVVAASRRRIASRVARKSPVAASTQSLSDVSESKPPLVTPRGFAADNKAVLSSAECGSVTCSISDASDDGPAPMPYLSDHAKNGSRRWPEPARTNRKPPLPVSAPKVAVVTPRAWPPAKVSRYPEEYSGGSSTGSTSALSEDDVRHDPMSPIPANSPFVMDEGSPGGAKAILSMWRERDKKNSLAERKR